MLHLKSTQQIGQDKKLTLMKKNEGEKEEESEPLMLDD
jgi:hypothetical protein